MKEQLFLSQTGIG